MRKIYIIRHCKTIQSENGRCISQTDFPLSEIGLEQAEALTEWALHHEILNVYTSPLKRCVETAAFAAGGKQAEVMQEFAEISVGEWEGLPFSEIKERWPQEYELRGQHMGTTAPPGGESFEAGGKRMDRAVRQIISQTKGDILIVAHAGILRGWLCKIAEISSDRVFEYHIPCGSVTEISWDGTKFWIDSVGKKTVSVPGEKEIQSFYQECGTPMEVQKHCIAAAQKAMELSNGVNIDKKMLYVAALLHDMCKTEGKAHPQKAAKRLKKAGYEKLAQIVAVHHDLPENVTQAHFGGLGREARHTLCDKFFRASLPSIEGFIDFQDESEWQQTAQEAELLYLADKLVRGTQVVTLEERFEASRKKCTNEAARAAWQKRYEDAIRLFEKYS